MRHTFILILSLLITSTYSFGQQNASTQVEGPKGLSVIPATISFSLAAGQTRKEKIEIVNNLPEKRSFKIYLVDWMRDSSGAHIMGPPGTFSRSCTRWVSLDKTAIQDLQPGQTQIINVTLQIPDSADAVKEMKWSLVVIETVQEKLLSKDSTKLTAGVQQQLRMGVHIYQTPPSLTEKGVKMLSFTKVQNDKGRYRIVCKNTGTTQLDIKSYMELSNLKDPKAKKIKIGPKKFPLFPEQVRKVDFVLPDTLSKGRYSVIGAVDGGTDVPLQAAQAVIELK